MIPSSRPDGSLFFSQGHKLGVFFPCRVDNATRIFFSNYDGVKWQTAKIVLPDGAPLSQTEFGVTAVFHDGEIHLLYKEQGAAALNLALWNGQKWICRSNFTAAQPAEQPAAVVFNDRVYVFYVNSSHRLMYVTYKNLDVFTNPAGLGDVPVKKAPSAVARGGLIHLFVCGETKGDTDPLLTATLSSDGHASGFRPVPRAFVWGGPAAVVLGEEIFCFHRAADRRGTLYYNILRQNDEWGGEREVPGISNMANNPGPCVFGGRIYCFVQGPRNELRCQMYVGKKWLDASVGIVSPPMWWSPAGIGVPG